MLIKTHILEKEYVRILFLIFFSCFFYYPFIKKVNIGADDAQYYLYMLADYIAQLREGIFPIYVTQSIYLPNGNPVILAPYYLILGSFLNLALNLKQSVLLTQHIFIIATSLLSGILVYINLRSAFKSLRWEAAIISTLYIGSPAVMSLIYKMDMYLSFSTVAFIPIVFLQLFIIFNSKKNNCINILYAACALSLIWLAHPPIAIWVSIFIFIWSIFYVPKKMGSLFVLVCIFMALSIWQIFPALSLGIDKSAYLPSGQPELILEELSKSLPDALLPLRLGSSGLYFLQLGYPLWSILIGGGFFALVVARNASILILTFIALGIAFLLFPGLGLAEVLWNLVPVQILKITYTWPNQRLYIILAAIACCIGAWFLNYVIANKNYKILNKYIPIILFILFTWNVYEAVFFTTNAIRANSSQINSSFNLKSWEDKNNLVSFKHYLPKSYTEHLQYKNSSHELFNLNSRLLRSDFSIISNGSNKEVLQYDCQKNGVNYQTNFRNEKSSPNASLTNSQFSLNGGLSFICFEANQAKDYFQLKVLDNLNRQVAYVGIHPGKSNLLNDSNLGIPVFIDSDHLNNGPYKLQAFPALPLDSIKNIKILSHFNTRSLPIKIDSLTPYRATFSKNIPETAFLEIDKAYFPGYLAKVNGTPEVPLQSPKGSLLIPIRNQKVQNTITLEYVGPISFRISFYISAVSWIVVIFLIIYLGLRNLKINARSFND